MFPKSRALLDLVFFFTYGILSQLVEWLDHERRFDKLASVSGFFFAYLVVF